MLVTTEKTENSVYVIRSSGLPTARPLQPIRKSQTSANQNITNISQSESHKLQPIRKSQTSTNQNITNFSQSKHHKLQPFRTLQLTLLSEKTEVCWSPPFPPGSQPSTPRDLPPPNPSPCPPPPSPGRQSTTTSDLPLTFLLSRPLVSGSAAFVEALPPPRPPGRQSPRPHLPQPAQRALVR